MRWLTLLLLVPACAPISSLVRGVEPTGEEYFPLVEESEWVYRIEDSAMGWTYEVTVVVGGERTLPGTGVTGVVVEERYASDTEPFFRAVEPIFYYWADGYLHRLFLTKRQGFLVPFDGLGEDRVLPSHLEAGAEWEGSGVRFFGGGTPGFRVDHSHRLARATETMELPAGRFTDCVRVDTVSRHGSPSAAGPEIVFRFSDWYARGVGLVRSEQWDDEGQRGLRLRIELLRYRIGTGGLQLVGTR